MTTVLLDTHAWYWLFSDAKRLPKRAIRTIEEADTALICSISVYEVARKAQIGKWPGMDANVLADLVQHTGDSGFEIASASVDAMRLAGFLDWSHRDPWDRLIAASAIDASATLVSADPVFDDLEMIERCWS